MGAGTTAADEPEDGLPVRSERGETEAQRIDRNWIELLQELRITQTGGQVLTGFLLIVPFQEQFTELGPGYRTLYLVVLSLALISTVLLVSPVMIHRAAFRAHRKDRVLRRSNTLAMVGLGFLGLALIGVVGLVFALVLGPVWGTVAAGVMTLLVGGALVVLPLSIRRGTASEEYG